MRARRRSLFAIGALAASVLVGFTVGLRDGSDAAGPLTTEHPPVLFVCRNGVAMSVWSALTFNRIAAERGLRVRAVSRAATPSYTRVPLNMRLGLALDGFRVGGYVPRVVNAGEVGAAERVILIDTELPDSVPGGPGAIEHWSGFPPMREKYFESRAALQQRVQDLVARLLEEQAANG